MRRRLTREIDDIDSAGETTQPSTGAVETDHNVVIRNLSSTTAVVTPSEWSATKDISEEARMLFQFIYDTNNSIQSGDTNAVAPSGSRADPEALPDNIITIAPSASRAGHFKNKIIEFFRNIFRIKKKVRLQVPSNEPEPPATEDTSEPKPPATEDISDNKDIIMSDEEILEFFTEALTANFEEVKFLLENTALLSMSDTGGQPEFMDMQPALVLGPALYLIFCKLTQSLQSHYSISYLSSSGDSTDPVESAYTVEEIIFQALSAVASLGTASSASPGSVSVSTASPGASPGVSTASPGASTGVSTASSGVSTASSGVNTASPGAASPGVSTASPGASTGVSTASSGVSTASSGVSTASQGAASPGVSTASPGAASPGVRTVSPVISSNSPSVNPMLLGVSNVSPGINITPSVNTASPDVGTASLDGITMLTPSKSKAIIVGTHGDLVSEDEIKAFDADLQRKIRATDFFGDGLIQFASKDRLVLAVNNKSGGVAEVRKIQKVLEDQMKHSFKKLTIPVSWLIFSVCLRKKAVRFTSLQSCLDLAKLLNIPPDEAKLAIWFLHHQAGLLMHFPDLPELHDSVICDLQIVYDSVTHLIVNTYKCGHVHQAASERFQQTGQFSLQDIREAIVDTSGDFIPLVKLVELLKHLNIIAQIDQTTSDSSAVKSGIVYFMPCVLPNAPSAELKVSHKSSSSKILPFPLMIRFKCGFVPTGVFTAMMANLASQQSLKMIVNGIRKNRVEFHFGKAFDTVTLICKAKHYEIHISRRPTAKTSTHEVCTAVRDLIQCTLENVASRFNYTFSLSYQLAFECPLPTHEGGDHLCVVESGDTCPDVMACLHDPKNIVPVDMEPQHLVWFGKVSKRYFLSFTCIMPISLLNLTATP